MKMILAWWRGLGRAFKRSLQLRVVTAAVVLGIAMVTIVGTVLTHAISDAIRAQRIEQLRSQITSVQTRVITELNDIGLSSSEAKLKILQSVISPLENPQISGAEFLAAYQIVPDAGTDIRAQFVETASTIPANTDASMLLSNELMRAVAGSEQVQWSITNIDKNGTTEPAVIMGALIPDQTTTQKFAVFLVYSTAVEAQTISVVQSALVWGGAALIILFVGIAFLGVRQVVLPVRHAAKVARQVADGDLGQRMTVRGTDEMATLSTSFNDMTLSLVDKIEEMEALTQYQQAFISDVAHELRTPITTIHMAADVIHQSSDEFDPVLARTSKLLVAQVERFESLLADLLEMSKFDAGVVELNIERGDLHTIVQRVIDMITPIADQQRSWLRVFPAEGDTRAEVDASRVERIIRNLVLNACEHGAGHPIDVEVGVNDDAVAVAVRDRGIGLAPEAATRVFDRFWRGDSSRKRTIGGSGLGLSIAAKDAELHQGELSVWGVKDEGAVFRLTLPRKRGGTFTRSPLVLEVLAEDLSYLLEQEVPPLEEPASVTETGEFAALAEVDVQLNLPNKKPFAASTREDSATVATSHAESEDSPQRPTIQAEQSAQNTRVTKSVTVSVRSATPPRRMVEAEVNSTQAALAQEATNASSARTRPHGRRAVPPEDE